MRAHALVLLIVVAACGGSHDAPLDAASDARLDPATCITRVSYGATWLAPPTHPALHDDLAGVVTWDGICTDDGANSFAELSNGFKPYFRGHSACVIALDANAACGAPAECTTHLAYGATWQPPANHPATYDDVAGRVFGDGVCHGGTYAELSNGFAPHFSGGACPIAFRYTQCGGLFTNPTVPMDCPDPGVLRDGDRYLMSCTSGDAAAAFPIYESTDLATWTASGHVFTAGTRPAWAEGDFWAPEIHRVGTHYVAYYSARQAADGHLSIGAAASDSPTGPFTDLGHPLVHDVDVGLIDVNEFTAADGTAYLLWKEDGNADGDPTPILIQRLAPDGLAVAGPVTAAITNDQPWEGAVTEGPFLVEHAGMYYLFYSGNSYANATYAVGVARAPNVMGPYTKHGDPILVTASPWVGPGHCSVVDSPSGETALVYHAWRTGCVNEAGCGRDVLLDLVMWGADGWPTVPLAPSSTTRPLP